MSATRDFLGYGGTPPDPQWPHEARVAVSFVINVEEGAERSIADGDERNEGTYESLEELHGIPDPCQDSHYEYGTRVGYWRVMEEFTKHKAVGTMNICGRAIERSPWIAQDSLSRGHELACHGWRWERHAGMSEAQERAAIARAVLAIKSASGGVAPAGWHTRSAASVNTRRLLLEHGGFLYDSDAYCDDLPFFVTVGDRRHLVLPYSFDTNDMHFNQGSQRFVEGRDFAAYVIDAYDRLWEEGAHAPRMMSIGLHLRMIGRPARIGALDMIFRHLAQKGGAWIARRDSIARHWLDRFG